MTPLDLPAVKDATRPDGILAKLYKVEKSSFSAGGITTSVVKMLRLLAIILVTSLVVGGGLLFLLANSTGNSSAGTGIIGFFGILTLVGAIVFFGIARVLGQGAKKVGYGNINRAESVIKSGNVAVDTVKSRINARKPSEAELEAFDRTYRSLDLAKVALTFDDWCVFPARIPVVLSFGNQLFVSQNALHDEDFGRVLARELASLNLGLSFVKAALWELGRGFSTERMSVFGMVTSIDSELDDDNLALLGFSVTKSVLFGSVGSVFLNMATWGVGQAARGTGASIQKLRLEVEQFLQKWQANSDVLAESIAHPITKQIEKNDFKEILPREADTELGADANSHVQNPEELFDASISSDPSTITLRNQSSRGRNAVLLFFALVVMILSVGIVGFLMTRSFPPSVPNSLDLNTKVFGEPDSVSKVTLAEDNRLEVFETVIDDTGKSTSIGKTVSMAVGTFATSVEGQACIGVFISAQRQVFEVYLDESERSITFMPDEDSDEMCEGRMLNLDNEVENEPRGVVGVEVFESGATIQDTVSVHSIDCWSRLVKTGNDGQSGYWDPSDGGIHTITLLANHAGVRFDLLTPPTQATPTAEILEEAELLRKAALVSGKLEGDGSFSFDYDGRTIRSLVGNGPVFQILDYKTGRNFVIYRCSDERVYVEWHRY